LKRLKIVSIFLLDFHKPSVNFKTGKSCDTAKPVFSCHLRGAFTGINHEQPMYIFNGFSFPCFSNWLCYSLILQNWTFDFCGALCIVDHFFGCSADAWTCMILFIYLEAIWLALEVNLISLTWKTTDCIYIQKKITWILFCNCVYVFKLSH